MEHVVVGVVVQWIIRVVCETSRAQRSLIVGDPAIGPRWSRAIIAKPLGVQQIIRGARRTWREDGAKWALGLESVLRQA